MPGSKPREATQRRDLANYKLKSAPAFSSQRYGPAAFRGHSGRGRFPDAEEWTYGAAGSSGSGTTTPTESALRLPQSSLPAAQREAPSGGPERRFRRNLWEAGRFGAKHAGTGSPWGKTGPWEPTALSWRMNVPSLLLAGGRVLGESAVYF